MEAYEAIYSSGLVYMMMIYQWIPQCDDLQFIRKGRVARCDKSRIWNVGLSLPSTTFWLANGRACLYLLFLWCYYERMANHGAILVWSSVLAGAQLRRDVIWYYWVVFTYKGMTSLTTYMMSWMCDLKKSWTTSRMRAGAFWLVLANVKIFGLKDSVKIRKTAQQFFPRSKRILNGIYSLRDALIVISAVFAPFLRLCAAR